MRSFSRRMFNGVEVACFDYGGQSFTPHFHDEFVLSVNVVGHERIKLDRKALEAAEGEITLYNPAQVQSSHAVSEEWQFLSLYVDPVVLLDLFDLSPETVFDKAVLAHSGAASGMKAAIVNALDAQVSEPEALERLVMVLDELLLLAGSRQATLSRHVPDRLKRVVERLADLAPLPDLAELSVEAGLTPVQLVRAFTRSYGLPPITWAWNLRVSEARVRLSRGEGIAHVAADLGFADQAHLTRRFRAMYGVTPGRWRRG